MSGNERALTCTRAKRVNFAKVSLQKSVCKNKTRFSHTLTPVSEWVGIKLVFDHESPHSLIHLSKQNTTPTHLPLLQPYLAHELLALGTDFIAKVRDWHGFTLRAKMLRTAVHAVAARFADLCWVGDRDACLPVCLCWVGDL